MTRTLLSIAFIGAEIMTPPARAQVQNYKPVTQEMLTNPSPNDWLMFSRTYDAQRYSPLNQITRQNVSQLGTGVDARTRQRHHGEHPAGARRRDVCDRAAGFVLALDATNGDAHLGIQASRRTTSRAPAADRRPSPFIGT